MGESRIIGDPVFVETKRAVAAIWNIIDRFRFRAAFWGIREFGTGRFRGLRWSQMF